ncbi:unnamed protein product [Litomosoides sigmodontis]|uniref:Uncharacterized protein n=1 Tax=Litomosoides sigmodontis TaxID=42156 RepID=A0A3P6UIT3_LITSI|nr:unnamed protein product [Litomosoides sigmodontis]
MILSFQALPFVEQNCSSITVLLSYYFSALLSEIHFKFNACGVAAHWFAFKSIITFSSQLKRPRLSLSAFLCFRHLHLAQQEQLIIYYETITIN